MYISQCVDPQNNGGWNLLDGEIIYVFKKEKRKYEEEEEEEEARNWMQSKYV